MGSETQHEAIRARDADVNYFTVCGLIFVFGLVVFIFMVVLCFKSSLHAASDMLLVLDAVQAALICVIYFAYRKMRKICRKSLGYSRAAVERRPSGTARIEFPAGKQHYYLEIPQEEKIAKNGMLNVWYDPEDPRNAFLDRKPEKPSFFGFASIGCLLLLSGIVNVIFFVILV